MRHLNTATPRPASRRAASLAALALGSAGLLPAAVAQTWPSSSPQVTDLLGGQVPMGFTQMAAAVPHIKDGRLNAIAVTGPQRSRHLPQVPTLAELGHKDLGTTIWFGLFAPATTPPAALDAIRAAAAKAHADIGYRARLEALDFDVPGDSPAEFEAQIAAESARWAALVKATGFRAAD